MRGNWSQLRDQIDRGESGDQRAVEDPAAAPLGTDVEAGGASTASEAIARSRRRVPEALELRQPHLRLRAHEPDT